MKYLIILYTSPLIFLLNYSVSFGQLSGFVKTGINIGTINKEIWTRKDVIDTFNYDKALIRPILEVGAQYRLSNRLLFRQAVLYQTKGQGSLRPDAWSLNNTLNKDILRFMSFPLSGHYRIFSEIYFGVGIQPSLYISGTDNYSVKEYWKGWSYGVIGSLHGLIFQKYEIGLSYDYDFESFFCDSCDERFITWRIYVQYHFMD